MIELRPAVRTLAMVGFYVLTACSSPSPAAQTDSVQVEAVQVEAVQVTVRPDPVYIERSESGQHLNFDFVLENRTKQELLLTSVELSAFDAAGQLLRRDFIDRFSRVSLELTPRRVLRPNRPSLVFNPFHSFAASVPIKKLRYELAFETENGKARHKSVAEIVPVRYDTKTALVLPLKGRVLVWDGHDYNSHHRRLDYTHPGIQRRGQTTNFQRYGYDFVLVNEQGVMYRGRPKDRDDWYRGKANDNDLYFAFGQPVYAAGAGRVVDAHDGEPDDRRVNQADVAKRETAIGGNYVVIDHLNGEYSWFGHLKQGSVAVKPGQMVTQREVIGQVGASGDSLFPHLHYELRTGPGIKGVEGLPSYFSGFRRVLGSGTVTVERGQVDTGDLVESP
jgi:murein DD-endopeptidase MepM/ murein hydrolase activator NlpD